MPDAVDGRGDHDAGAADPRPPHRRARRRPRQPVFLARLPARAAGHQRRARTSRRWSSGAISVTPLRLDMTAYDLGDPLRHHFAARKLTADGRGHGRGGERAGSGIADLILRLRRAGVTDQRVLAAMEAVPRDLFVAAREPARGLCRAGAADRLRPDHLGPGDRRDDDRGPRSRRPATACSRSAPAAATRRRCCRSSAAGSTPSTASAPWSPPPSRASRRSASPTSPPWSAMAPRAGRRRRPSTGSSSPPPARRFPDALLDQVELGGIIVAPVGPQDGVQKLKRLIAHARAGFDETDLADVRFVPLIPGTAARL